MVQMSFDEWVSRLKDMPRDEESPGHTVAEITEQTGMTDQFVRRYLGQAKQAGVLRVGTKYYEALDGHMRPKPVYWIESDDEKKGKKK